MVWHLDEMNSRRLKGQKKTQREGGGIHNIKIYKYKKEKIYSIHSIFYTFFYVRALTFFSFKEGSVS